MKNLKILEMLKNHYLDEAQRYNKEYEEKTNKVYEIIDKIDNNNNVELSNEIYMLNADIESIVAEQNFVAGFKYAFQLMKECGLL